MKQFLALFYRCMLCALGVLLCSTSVLAEEEGGDYALESVTVTARGVDTPVSLTPGGVGVVDQEEIREVQPVSVTDVISRLAGVSRTDDSPWGSDVNIRGLGRDSVVILVDGCRVNTTTDINGRLGLVNPEDVERIEVLKGPISSLYGSGSTGGVVNIITKQGKFSAAPEWNGEAFLGGSTNPQGPDTYMNLSYNTDSAWMYVSGAWREHESYYAGGDTLVPNSQYSDFYGKVAGAVKWNDRNETHVMYQSMDGSEIGIPGTGTAPLPANAEVSLKSNTSQLLEIDHTYRPESGALKESTLKFYYQLIKRNPRIDDFTSGAVAWIEPQADHETLAGDWRNVLELGDHKLVAGMDGSNWYMTSTRTRTTNTGVQIVDSPTPDTNQFTGGVYAEDDWTLNQDWILNLGGRVDYVTISSNGTPTAEAGTHDDTSWNGHVGLTRVLDANWTVTGIAASSYRTPNILEMYKNLNLGGGVSEVGNPNLDPERSMFFELGLHRSGGPVRLDAAVYANYLDDMIAAQLVSPTLYRMENVAHAEIYGAELSLEWDFATGWMAYGNAAYTYGRDVTEQEYLRFIPPLNGLLGVRQDLDWGFWWLAESEWSAGQYDVPDGALTSDSWVTVNLRCGYTFTVAELKNELTFSVNNVFDERYVNHLATSRGIELHEPGISAVAGWRLTF